MICFLATIAAFGFFLTSEYGPYDLKHKHETLQVSESTDEKMEKQSWKPVIKVSNDPNACLLDTTYWIINSQLLYKWRLTQNE